MSIGIGLSLIFGIWVGCIFAAMWYEEIDNGGWEE